jgi:hypothetical protein
MPTISVRRTGSPHINEVPAELDRAARRLVCSAYDGCDWLTRSDFAAVLRWARTETRVQRLVFWLDELGELDEHGNVRPAADLLTRLDTLAARLAARLGFDPASRATMVAQLSSSADNLEARLDKVIAGWGGHRLGDGHDEVPTTSDERDDG